MPSRTGKPASAPHPDDLAAALERLRRAVHRHAPTQGVYRIAPAAGVEISRFDRPHRQLQHGLYTPCVALIVQGGKQVWMAHQEWRYEPAQWLLYTLDVPVTGQVTQASRHSPCLCVRLELDAARLSAWSLRLAPGTTRRDVPPRAVAPAPADVEAVEDLARLLEVCAQAPDRAAVLAPPIEETLWLRLLLGSLGPALVEFARAGSTLRRLQPVLAHLRAHLDRGVPVAELARQAHMSESGLHHQFKAVLGMSPLQYHKALRLQEARRLLAGGLEVGRCAERVGYASPAQFSREYTRFFGYPPSREAGRRVELALLAAG